MQMLGLYDDVLDQLVMVTRLCVDGDVLKGALKAES